MIEAKWKTLSKKPIESLVQEVASLVNGPGGHQDIHIGTDAQKNGKYTDFVTAVVVLNPGKGGVAFYAKVRMPFINSLQHKLFTEVSFSLEVALALCEQVPAELIQIHVDANTNLKWESGPFHQQLAGMVVGHGFKALLKPESWAASHVADHCVKNKNNVGWKSKRQRRKRA